VAVDYFLKIDGVPGESADAKHKGEIQLESFSWGETNPGGGGVAVGGGGGAGKVQMQDLVVTMVVSKASPKLLLGCATGKHYKEAVLTVRKAGKSQQEYLIIKLKDIIVTSYQTGGSAQSDLIVDQASLGFSTIQMDYRPQKADGSLDAAVKAGWDLKQNKPL
jgi:type VI secretion system secreted protein Hcp